MCTTRTACGPQVADVDRNRSESGLHADRIWTAIGPYVFQVVAAMTFGPKSSVGQGALEPRLMTLMTRSNRMYLTPKLPPGRANRKALAFVAEINRLRAAGYSFEAIRLALLDAGVHVSRTTVKREAARGLATANTTQHGHILKTALTVAPTGAADEVSTSVSFAGDARSGKEIAEAFMKRRVNNPLMQERK